MILAAFVVVVPFWEPGNTGLATENYNVAFWDHESKISFVYEQYGALAHSLLNGRLDLMQDPPEELLALDNPYDSTAREEAQVNSLWDMPIITDAIMSISASCPVFCFSFHSRLSPASKTWPIRPA